MVAGAKRPAAASAAGPRKKPRKDAAAGTSLPSASAPAASKPTARQPRRRTHARLAPLKPATNQTVTGRPTGAGLANPTREIRGRNVIFVTRKTGLGAYMKRCKALLVEEGLSQITLYGLGAAIPHTLLVLYALLDILPYPRQYVTHELRTSTVECTDEMLGASGLDELERHGLSATERDGKGRPLEVFEEEESEMRTRQKSALEIVVRIGKPSTLKAGDTAPDGTIVPKRKTRPNKRKRAKDRQAAVEAQTMAEEDQIDGAGSKSQDSLSAPQGGAPAVPTASGQSGSRSGSTATRATPTSVAFNEEDMMNE